MIAVVDYGAGNLHSVKNALDYLGADSVVTSDISAVKAADKLILPGVGSFGEAMDCLNKSGLCQAVRDFAKSGKPFLGICLGLHMLFEESEESPGVKGLGVLKGRVVKIPEHGLKIPHMGWNSIETVKESKILKNMGDEPFVYFVHSYYIKPDNKSDVSAVTQYGETLSVAVERDNLFAVQFHPEKSGDTGLEILRNFIGL